MFLGRRNPVLHVLLLLMGIKLLKRERWTEDEKAAYRTKRRLFRSKMREAFDVWDEPLQSNDEEDVKPSTEN